MQGNKFHGALRVPTFDALLQSIEHAPSPQVLAQLLGTATTYFTGTQREQLEVAVEARRSAMS
jgi:hypothetical protein